VPVRWVRSIASLHELARFPGDVLHCAEDRGGEGEAGGGGGFSKPSLTRVWTHSGGSGRTHSFPLERGEFHGKLQNCRMHFLSNPFTVTQILGYHRPDTCRIRPLHEFSFLRTPLRSSVSLRWKYEYRSDGHQRNATEQTNAKTLCDRRRPEPWLRGVSPHLQTPPPPPRNPAASFLVAGGPWEHQHTRVASLCIALLGTFCAATSSGKNPTIAVVPLLCQTLRKCSLFAVCAQWWLDKRRNGSMAVSSGGGPSKPQHDASGPWRQSFVA